MATAPKTTVAAQRKKYFIESIFEIGTYRKEVAPPSKYNEGEAVRETLNLQSIQTNRDGTVDREAGTAKRLAAWASQKAILH